MKSYIKSILFKTAPYIFPDRYRDHSPIFCFHRVVPSKTFNRLSINQKRFSVTTTYFDSFISLIKELGYEDSSLNEIISDRKENNKRNKFHITFDDGYKDNLIHAEPILRKHNISATFYITTSMLEKGNKSKLPYLSLADSKKDYLSTADLSDFVSRSDKYNFGGHSHTHQVLSQVKHKELKNEIFLPKKILEDAIGKEIYDFAFPFGGENEFNQKVIDVLKDSGYKTSVTSLPYFHPKYDERMAYPRYFITQSCDKISILGRLSGLSKILRNQLLR